MAIESVADEINDGLFTTDIVDENFLANLPG
jgi:hypothetical protein